MQRTISHTHSLSILIGILEEKLVYKAAGNVFYKEENNMSKKENSMSISLTGDETLNTAVSLFVRDHVTEAYPLFQELAKEGNPRALYFISWANIIVKDGLAYR